MMNHLRLSVLSVLAACSGEPPQKPSADSGQWQSPDVAARLSDGQVRAGIVSSGEALFGGVSAEGREGDYKIYNARVQFIIQGIRPGDYYESYGGGLIDADMVRPEGDPGRDIIDEMWVMVGLGRVLNPTKIEVISDGTDGSAAVVRVTGEGAPMTLLTGAFERPDFVANEPVTLVTDYTLQPDAWLLEAETRVQWNGSATSVQIGDAAMIGKEVVHTVLPGRGLEGADGAGSGEWVGAIGARNEVALGLFSAGTPFTEGAVATLLEELGPVLPALGPIQPIEAGAELTLRRYIGVGPDLATLTAAWHTAEGRDTESIGGRVTASGTPVAGARVHVREGSSLKTIAFTDGDGEWTADVVSTNPTVVATGRGTGEIVDLPDGSGWIAPYAHAVPKATSLSSLQTGSSLTPFAEGYGISDEVPASADTQSELTAPGLLSVTVEDGGPAAIRVDFADGDPVSADRALVPARPGGDAAYGWLRDGSMEIPLEPGEYVVTVHRGVTHEPTVSTVTITSAETTALSAELPKADYPEGLLTADPHSHASPSGDGKIPMSHRLITQAANGVQVHFGTDHDHVADYRPLLSPLGLDAWLTSILADEVSPILRGHTNVYPLETLPDEPNNGAMRWWDGVETTDSYYQDIRATIGADAILQLNHPTGSSGMLGLADYDVDEGVVGRPSHFSERFDAMEVLNDGSYSSYLPLYVDLVARGYEPTPIGVSDSHGYRNGQGESFTWLLAGVSQPGDLSNSLLTDVMKTKQLIVSRGPYLDVRAGTDWAPGTTLTGASTLTVDISGPSFVVVDTITVLRDGDTLEQLAWEGTPIDIELPTDADGSYVIIAEGSASMAPVYPGTTPWALAPAIRVDVDGDGWEPPKAALIMGN